MEERDHHLKQTDPLWTRGCGRGRRVIGAQSWGNKYSLQRSEEALGRRDWSQALARCRIGGGAGKLLCQVGVGVSLVRVSVYMGNVFLTLSPPCSSASWSRSMISWINSKKEQSGCSPLSVEKSLSMVSLHFLRPNGSLEDSHRSPGWGANELAFKVISGPTHGDHRFLRGNLRAELASREHIHLFIYH